MEEARESACNDMGKMLQLVLPVATQIQQEVIKAYGFNNEGEGEHEAYGSHSKYKFTVGLKMAKRFLWLDADKSWRKDPLCMVDNSAESAAVYEQDNSEPKRHILWRGIMR